MQQRPTSPPAPAGTASTRGGGAPGKPGAPPRWMSGRKAAVGAARGPRSRVWFTLECGILAELYYPHVDQAAVRELGLVVTDGERWCSEERFDAESKLCWLVEGVPAYRVENTCRNGKYVIEKTIIADPRRNVVLQRTRLRVGRGLRNLHLYALLAPHLGDSGADNDARVGDYAGIPMLFGERAGSGLALACSAPWLKRSAGYVGVSDGWQELRAHGRMIHEFTHARDGNVALTGEIAFADGADFTLALGFGRTATEAGHHARASLNQGFDSALELYVREWREWQDSLVALEPRAKSRALYHASKAVLGVHESKDFPGAIIAALSFPWGLLGRELDAGRDRGGYHLVWPRDACEAASALVAAGDAHQVGRTLDYLETTQLSDGSWPQNMWLDGTRFWSGVQLDEAAAPILLLDLARRHGALTPGLLARLWPLVRSAAAFVARTGPLTPQDRWEDVAGLAPYSLGAAIAALLVAAELAEQHRESALAAFFRETADAWHDSIDEWLYAAGTPLACAYGVAGYYVRSAPASQLTSGATLLQVEARYGAGEHDATTADQLVSVDALGLVRFGLRRADDPRIVDSVRMIDALLRVTTPAGPCWHRYSHDCYGEHADGSAFDGGGIGRAWPLLVGERAHYELARGDADEARRLLHVMEELAGPTLLLPEQVWDAEPIPERDLAPGRATRSARPLVWAHAEYVKLVRSLSDGAVFDVPPQTRTRYLEQAVRGRHASWRFDRRTPWLAAGHTLRIETSAPTRVRWSDDDWSSAHDADSLDLGIGLYVTDLPTSHLRAGRRVLFTCFWPEAEVWEGEDFCVEVYGAR